MTKKKNKNNIIIIVIISILIVGGVVTWGFLTDWWQNKKSTNEPVKYKLQFSIPEGSEKIELKNPESHGFKIGQKIEIGTGDKKEIRTIVGFGSLILDKPLEYEHSENTEIIVIEEPVKKDFKVDNCVKYNNDLKCKECKDSHYLEDNICKEYSYTGTQDDCNKDKGIFTAGTSSSDQTCKKCEDKENQWIDTSNGKQVCKDYSYTAENCNGERQIFIPGTDPTSDNSDCVECGNDEYVKDNECFPYTYTGTKDGCNQEKKIFTQGTSSSDQTCLECGINSYYLGNNKCQDYTYIGTKDNCNKNVGGIFTEGTSSSDQTCVKCHHPNSDCKFNYVISNKKCIYRCQRSIPKYTA